MTAYDISRKRMSLLKELPILKPQAKEETRKIIRELEQKEKALLVNETISA